MVDLPQDPSTFDPENTPEVPRINVDKFLAEAGEYEIIFRRYRGEYLTQEVITGIASRLNTLEDGRIRGRYVQDTLLQYGGRRMTDGLIRLLCAQFWARRDELREGPLYLYEHPVRMEWVALEFLAWKWVEHKGKRGVEFILYAHSGHPAGHTLKLKVTQGWMRYLAYQIGFSRTKTFDDEEPWLLVGLRLWGFLIPDENREELRFVKWEITNKVLKRNRAIIRLRRRFNENTGVENPECPYDIAAECNECGVGEDKCPASTIRKLKP